MTETVYTAKSFSNYFQVDTNTIVVTVFHLIMNPTEFRWVNPLMAIGNYSYQFLICCPRDCVSRTANVEGTARH